MDGEAILAIINAHGPTQTSDIVTLLAAEGVQATSAAAASALRKLEAQGRVACTPRDNWRLAGELAVEHAANRRAATEARERAKVRRFIYSPEIIRDVPRLTSNSLLLFCGLANGGFRLRYYADDLRVEVKQVAGITKTVFLEAAYPWTAFDLDADDERMPVMDGEFWSRRLAALNAAHSALLAEGAAVAGCPGT